MDQRRVLLAVTLSLAIVIAYQELVVKRFYPPSDTPALEAATPPVAAPPLAGQPAGAPAAVPAAPAPADAARPAIAAGRDVVVDTPYYRAIFTTAGARLRSLELKHYRATVQPQSPLLQMVQFPDQTRLPLGLSLRGAGQQLDDAGVLYDVDQTEVDLPADGTETITFTGQLPGGATARKRITLRGNDYLWAIDVDVSAVPRAYTEMALGWEEGLDPAGANAAEVVFDNVLVLQEGKLEHIPFANLTEPRLIENNVGWTGFGGRYFLAAFIPQADEKNAMRVWARQQAGQNQRAGMVETQVLFPPGQFAAHADLYLGPKDIDRLEAIGHGLRKAVDLGWFTFIALPLLQALRFLNGFVGNYGVAIIILTVVIKGLFYPLTKKSFESMREMQKLQPEMQKLRERLKDKPEAMNKEIMELYRQHKVNPLGGCLPMVLQIPVFVGLYNALLNAVELRHAPFVGWIHDLSAPDRFGTLALPFVHPAGFPILTLAMGGTMFLQQWMTPSPADPAQQRIMLIMPVMFTFMFLNFPAGLVLYWLVNNVLTIAQQYSMMRKPA